LLEQYSYLPLDEKLQLMHAGVRRLIDDDRALLGTLSRVWSEAGAVSLHSRLRYLLVRVHLPGLLQAMDAMGMSCGVETRFPYLDHRLVEWAMGLPQRATMRWRSIGDLAGALREPPEQYSERRDITKLVLRDAFEASLPANVIARRKMAFPAPLEVGLRGHTGAELREMVLGPDARIAELFDSEALRDWWHKGSSQGSATFGRQAWVIVALEAWLRVYLPSGPLVPVSAPPHAQQSLGGAA
jgi:asparagine synthase (glutamine-hydrolysing)